MKRLVLACAVGAVACASPYLNVPYKPDPAPWTPSCVDLAIDWQDATCKDPAWQVSACGAPILHDATDAENRIVSLPQPLTYADAVPVSGAHRPDAARWGEYAYLPPQRWLANLEDGGVVALYHPCAPAQLVDELLQFLRALPVDDGGPTRWILTPAPGLPTAFALVTWQHSLGGNCLDTAAANAFVQAHYRHGPDDSALVGSYAYAWIGKDAALLTAPSSAVPTCADPSAVDASP